MPYAALIQNREARRLAEIASKRPPVDGTVAQDLIGAIRLGQSSVAALARDIRVSVSIVRELASRMAFAGYVELRGTNRGLYVALLPRKGDPGEWI
jgi:DNA-binding GntR family transcriptional regulator